MPVDSAVVENAKSEQKLQALQCKDSSFDEAIFWIAREPLKKSLLNVSGLGHVSEEGEIFAAYRAFILDQIRLLVDEAIYLVFATDNLLEGHRTIEGRRRKVVKLDHSVLQQRAGRLVRVLQPELNGRDARKRITGVRTTVSNVMNTQNWDRHAQVFWRMYGTPAKARPA